MQPSAPVCSGRMPRDGSRLLACPTTGRAPHGGRLGGRQGSVARWRLRCRLFRAARGVGSARRTRDGRESEGRRPSCVRVWKFGLCSVVSLRWGCRRPCAKRAAMLRSISAHGRPRFSTKTSHRSMLCAGKCHRIACMAYMGSAVHRKDKEASRERMEALAHPPRAGMQ